MGKDNNSHLTQNFRRVINFKAFSFCRLSSISTKVSNKCISADLCISFWWKQVWEYKRLGNSVVWNHWTQNAKFHCYWAGEVPQSVSHVPSKTIPLSAWKKQNLSLNLLIKKITPTEKVYQWSHKNTSGLQWACCDLDGVLKRRRKNNRVCWRRNIILEKLKLLPLYVVGLNNI